MIDAEGPIAGARVRVRTGDHFVTTDSEGTFLIEGVSPDESVTLTAWAPGYFIAAAEDVTPRMGAVTIELHKHGDQDHEDYKWVSPYASAGEEANCQNCHSDESGLLPFEEWVADAHSQSLANHRFLTLYSGTDLAGNSSPPTRYIHSRDYGTFPLPPNPKEPYYGSGYKLDFPKSQGNCAACHVPAAAINAPYQTDPTLVDDPDTAGITCDFCHKIWDVRLDETTGLPYSNTPGVLSYEYRRPGKGHQFFAGPFDDVAPGEDTYTPIQTESAYCAGCHFGTFWDTTIYNSYGEWLASSYSDPDQGRTCQDCHMPVLGTSYFAIPEKGGLERNPEQIVSHRMLGIRDETFMADSISLKVDQSWQNQLITIQVEIENDNTGHKIPTDSPLRNLLLLVTASDQDGNPLEQLSGPQLPDWAGSDHNKKGHYGGDPGKGYAFVLQEKWTGISPTAAYWNPVLVVEDSRLSPFQVDESEYQFTAPQDGLAVIHVQVIFRRAFIEIAELKDWGVEDLILQEIRLELVQPEQQVHN